MHAKPIKFFKKDDTSTYKLIKDKVINHSEIVVNFFDYCNMRCAFCSQDHESKEGMSRLEILEKIPYILNYINTNNSNLFLLHLMGGELFQDELIDNNFLEYFSEFIETLEKQKPTGVELNYNFITNLVFTRTDKVIEFLNKHNLKIAISYDPVARFTPKQLVQFKTNVDIFKPYIRMVSSVMTKQNMNAIISEDNYFKYLYDNFTIHFDHLLIGNLKFDYMMPTEKDMYAFYCFLLDTYPNCVNVLQYNERGSSISKMSCTRGNSFTLFSDNTIPIGCSGSVVLKDNKTSDNWSTKIIDNFLTENDCLTCEFYSRCNLTCFVHNDYKKLVKDIDGCVYKKVFEYADKKNYN